MTTMLTSNIWAKRACETCKESPPRKIPSINIHLKFSQTGNIVIVSIAAGNKARIG